jgi:hypothetical protein
MKPNDEPVISRIDLRFFSKPRLNLPLALDMGKALHLEVTLGRISQVILAHSALDIDRMSTVPLNEVGIIAVDEAK